MKRSRQSSGSVSRAKSSKTDGGEGRAWPLKPGMILEVNLRNFMCHETFCFKPNQRINFLCGENGSGKSAILTAIVFGLGGTARMANRGSSNKVFIRTGQTSATVEIKMYNIGDTCYKFSKYGESITVQRTVTMSSSSYKLKNHEGKVVQDKKVKEELNRILNQFNIQVENPIVVLNQDASKTFLAKSDPIKLYQFFHRSTQLKDCEDLYRKAEIEKDAARSTLIQKKEAHKGLRKEYDYWRKRYDHMEGVLSRQRESNTKLTELAWAMVRDSEFEEENIRRNAEKEEKKIVLAEREIEGIAKKDKEMRATKKEVEKEIQDIAKNYDDQFDNVERLKNVFGEKKRKSQAVSRTVEECQKRINKCEKNYNEVKREIDRYRSGKFREYEEKRLERQKKRDQIEEEMTSLSAQIEVSENHLAHLKSNKWETDQAASTARLEYISKQRKVESLQHEIQDLEKGEKNKLRAFGNWMPKVVSEIKNCRKFSKQPIGPLGAEISLKEGTSDDTATIIEGELGGLLLAFCVDSNKDQMILFDIFKRMNLPRFPSIITSEFSEARYDLSRTMVQSDKFITLVDCIETSSPTVFNTLVDNAQLERIIIIPSSKEAQSLLTNPETVPKNLSYAVVDSKYIYYPAPNYKSYYKEFRSKNLLKASLEELIAHHKLQVEEEKNNVALCQKNLEEENSKVKEAMRLISEEEKKIRQIRQILTKKNSAKEALITDDYAEQPPDIAALEDDREKFVSDLEKLKEDLEGKEKSRDEHLAVEETAGAELEQAEKAFNEKSEKIDPLKAKLSECENGIRKNKNDIDNYTAKKGEYRKRVQNHKEALENAQKVTALNVKKALEKGEKIETRKSVESLRKEIAKLQGNTSEESSSDETVALIRDKFHENKTIYLSVKVELMQIEKLIVSLESAIIRRKDGYKLMLRSTAQVVQRNFTTQLNVRKFVGMLNFSHGDQTMEVKVNPIDSNTIGGMNIDRDLKSLSGGERSFTLVSLVLSLWNVMCPPFRILDEFDVFMDAVHRKIAIQNIINYAREDRGNQFLFLTPLDTNNIIVNKDLKIIKLQKRQH